MPPPRTSSAAAAPPVPSAGLKRPRDAGALVRRLALPGGVLDPSILNSVEAIAQQSNCVGCDGRGLAAGVAATLAYGCPYRARRRMPPANKFAVPEDRPTPGTSASTRAEPSPRAPARVAHARARSFAQSTYARLRPAARPAPPSCACSRNGRWAARSSTGAWRRRRAWARIAGSRASAGSHSVSARSPRCLGRPGRSHVRRRPWPPAAASRCPWPPAAAPGRATLACAHPAPRGRLPRDVDIGHLGDTWQFRTRSAAASPAAIGPATMR